MRRIRSDAIDRQARGLLVGLAPARMALAEV
jgi:hypothetical protein